MLLGKFPGNVEKKMEKINTKNFTDYGGERSDRIIRFPSQ
jgi:hypothetical protein